MTTYQIKELRKQLSIWFDSVCFWEEAINQIESKSLILSEEFHAGARYSNARARDNLNRVMRELRAALIQHRASRLSYRRVAA